MTSAFEIEAGSAPTCLRPASLVHVHGRKRFNAATGAGLIVSIRLMGAGLAYLTQIALARWMGGFQYGIYAYAWSLMMLLGFVAPLGVNISVLRHIPDYLVRGKLRRLAGHIQWAPRIVLITSTLFSAALAGLLYLSRDFVAPHYLVPLIVTAICLPFFALSVLFECMARGFGWLVTAYGPTYVLRPVLFILFAGGATIVGTPLDATSVMVIMLMACVATVAFQSVMIFRSIPAAPRPSEARHHRTYWFLSAMPLLAIEICNLILMNTDVLMLGYFGTPEQVGQYFAVVRTCSFLGYVSFGITGLAIPKFAEFNSRGDREGLARFVRNIVRVTFLPTLVGAVVLALTGKHILAFFGGQFTTIYPVLLMLLIGILVRAATGPVEYLLAMNGHQRNVIVILVMAASLNILLNLILIPAIGLMGAALATNISIAFSAFTATLLTWRKLGIRSFII